MQINLPYLSGIAPWSGNFYIPPPPPPSSNYGVVGWWRGEQFVSGFLSHDFWAETPPPYFPPPPPLPTYAGSRLKGGEMEVALSDLNLSSFLRDAFKLYMLIYITWKIDCRPVEKPWRF
uniref:Reverse transcriptase n=1 Tax=Morchella brunnea TaxID=1174671 RepID=A0A8K1I7U5_9PEZI|nr:reverse transcriptase [Morchella brunnea]UBU98528.1 reverse transcriptase [Morchella brunnea]